MYKPKNDAISTLQEKVDLINKLTKAVTTAYNFTFTTPAEQDLPSTPDYNPPYVDQDCIDSISIYGSEYRISLRGEDDDKRTFTFKLLSLLKIGRLKRNLDSPSSLNHIFTLEAFDRWNEKNLTFSLRIDNFPCKFKTECTKTCYAVYEDGRRVPVVKKGNVR